jgi:arsenite methyltransferase
VVSATTLDHWSDWLVRTRFSGWPQEEVARVLADLESVRDAVLDHVRIRADDTVVDVGTGTGLIAFGALARLGSAGRTVALDISDDCLRAVAQLAADHDDHGRLQCVRGHAAALPLAAAVADAITTRSVLIYLSLADKAVAAREFARVLRSGGRVSLFEPVNRLNEPLHDVVDFGSLGPRVASWEDASSTDPADPLTDFDAADLERCFAEAGFGHVETDLRRVAWPLPAEAVLTGVLVPGRRPLIGQWGDLFTPEETVRLADAVRRSGPLVTRELAVLYLTAVKP